MMMMIRLDGLIVSKLCSIFWRILCLIHLRLNLIMTMHLILSALCNIFFSLQRAHVIHQIKSLTVLPSLVTYLIRSDRHLLSESPTRSAGRQEMIVCRFSFTSPSNIWDEMMKIRHRTRGLSEFIM
jgi:hypothetical protein